MKAYLLKQIDNLFKLEEFSVKRIYGRFGNIFNHIHDCQSVLNDVKVKLIDKIEKFDIELEKFGNKGFIYTCIKNGTIDFYKSKKRIKENSFDPSEIWKLDLITEANNMSAGDVPLLCESISRVAKLNIKEKGIFIDHFNNNLSYLEISKKYNIKLTDVGNKIRSLKKKIAKYKQKILEIPL